MWKAAVLALVVLVPAACGGAAGSSRSDDEVTFVEPMTVVGAGNWALEQGVALTEITFVHRAHGEVHTLMFRPQERLEPPQLERAFRAETVPSLRAVARKLRRQRRQWLAVQATIAAVGRGVPGVQRVTVCRGDDCPHGDVDSGP